MILAPNFLLEPTALRFVFPTRTADSEASCCVETPWSARAAQCHVMRCGTKTQVHFGSDWHAYSLKEGHGEKFIFSNTRSGDHRWLRSYGQTRGGLPP